MKPLVVPSTDVLVTLSKLQPIIDSWWGRLDRGRREKDRITVRASTTVQNLNDSTNGRMTLVYVAGGM